jgi:hypothetical protein
MDDDFRPDVPDWSYFDPDRQSCGSADGLQTGHHDFRDASGSVFDHTSVPWKGMKFLQASIEWLPCGK